MSRWILIAALLIAGPATAQDETPTAPEPALERAREASRDLAVTLMSRLMEAMGQGGPTSAVETCHEVAQEIAKSHSVDGLSIRRVSLKTRNAADEPDAFEREQLEALEETQRQGGKLPDEIVRLVDAEGGKTLRYMRPIVIQGPCLQCHGAREDLNPEVLLTIEAHYPSDEAVGYKIGDLRGAFSVQVSLPDSPPQK